MINLGSTDAAPEVPHPRPTRPDAATRRGRRCPRVRPRPAASGHVDPTWVSSTRADASRFGVDARRREPIRADSGLNRPVSADIGRYRPISAGIGRYRPVSAGIGRYRRNRPESAETAETADSGRNSKKKKKKKDPERTVY
ncbi:hypothetical protein RGQ29_024442 [Quercus rubra]|uniref:Uncharacterized protein n=1 Tax=Quercus rubra TaxID=3512 RepID=A0AAN7IP98_QUERU|nr:hypothetical protein RGQ29_024442 [Quercus rubra]